MKLSLSKKQFYLAVLISFLFFGLGFSYQYYLPRIESWLLIEVENQSKKHSPLRVWPEKVSINIFALSVSVYNIKLLPQGHLKKILKPTSIEEITASLSLLGLLRGEIRLSDVTVKNTNINLNLNHKFKLKGINTYPQKTTGFIKTDITGFNILKTIPIDELNLEKINISVTKQQKDNKINLKVLFLNLSAENLNDTLLVNLATPQVLYQDKDVSHLKISVQTKLSLSNEEIRLAALKVKQKNSYVVASGIAIGDIIKGKISKTTLKTRAKLNLNDVDPIAKSIKKDLDLPKMIGSTLFDVSYKKEKNHQPQVSFKVETAGVSIDGYVIGNLKAKGQLKEKSLKFNHFSIRNAAGHVKLNSAHVSLEKPYLVSAQVNATQLEIRRLLLGLRAGDTPLKIDMDGLMSCAGPAYPLKLKCQGQINASEIYVHSGEPENFSIVHFKKINAKGSVEVDLKKVRYQAHVKLGPSTGKSSGTITYATGFKIAYEANLKDLTHIDNLAHLKIEGALKLKGTTRGDSSYGISDMRVDGKKLWLEDYGIGKAKSRVRYKGGILSFENLAARYGSSRYQGDISINLLENKIFVKAHSNFLNSENLASLFSRQVKLPFNVTGAGQATLKAWGPLKFNRLNYDLRFTIYRGSAFDETFDQFDFNVTSRDGYVKASRVQLMKAGSLARLTGKANPDGDIKVSIKGENFRLEQSENLNQLGLNASGHLDFQLDLSGYILKPDTDLKGQLSHVMVSDESAENSQFRLKLREETIEGSANMIGGVVQSHFILPLSHTAPLKLYIKAKNWKFHNFFNLIFSDSDTKGYDSLIDFEAKIDSPSDGIWKSNGYLDINNFYLISGSSLLKSKTSQRIYFDNGAINADNIKFEGPQSYIVLNSKNSSKHKLNAHLNGNFNLEIFKLLTPFMSELRGRTTLSASLSGRSYKPELLGSTYIQKALIKFKEFPHAFEQVNADIIFNQNNLLINSIKGKLGNGPFTASGKMYFNGIRNMPLDIKGQVQGISLNVPEGIQTTGSSTFSLSNNWFPYLLKANYNVQSGTISKAATSTDEDSKKIKPGEFLPKFISEDNFEPLQLDLNINVLNPVNVSAEVATLEVESRMVGNIRVAGPPSDPILNGRISTLPGSQALFNSNTFEIQNGHLEYKNAKAGQPKLNITANTRVAASGSENETVGQQSYDVNLLVQGTPIKPIISLNSQPPLPEQDIISLLALGIIANEQKFIEPSDDNTNLNQKSYEINSKIVGDQIGLTRQIKDKLGVEVGISSQFTEAGSSNRSTVTIKKQLNPSLDASASRTIEKNPSNKVQIEYKINHNLSTVLNWEDNQTEKAGLDENKTKTQDVFGIDLEYKFEYQ